MKCQALGSTLTFTRDLSCIASIYTRTHVKITRRQGKSMHPYSISNAERKVARAIFVSKIPTMDGKGQQTILLLVYEVG